MTSPGTPKPPAPTAARPAESPPSGPHPTDGVFDVVIVGGAAAGLSAAVVLGRARRSVVVVDGGEPRNAPAAGVHSYLTRDGLSPAALIDVGQAEARSYGVQLVSGQATASHRTRHGISVTLDDGRVVTGRRLIVATGLVDELPDLPGLGDRWGRDVLHCPYCHGWEVRDQAIGVLGTGPKSVHQALLFRQWSGDVTLFLHADMLDATGRLDAQHGPTDAEWEQLAALGIRVVIGPVDSLLVHNDALTGVRLASGQVFPVNALVVAPTFTARTAFLTGLGVTAAQHPLGVGSHLPTDEAGRALNDEGVVPGVWAAGNANNLMAQVAVAAAAGLSVAAAVNADLISADLTAAVERYRRPFSADAEARNAVDVLGERRHGIVPPAGRQRTAQEPSAPGTTETHR